MRRLLMAAVLCGTVASARGEGRVTVTLGEGAKLASWIKGSESWLEVNGTATVSNGTSVPIEQLEIAAQLYQTLRPPNGDPIETKGGSGSQSDWLPTPIGPGVSATVTLKMRISGGGLLMLNKSIELSVPRIGTGKKKTRFVPAPGVVADGLDVTLSGPVELESWVVLENVDSRATAEPTFHARASGSTTITVRNQATAGLRKADVMFADGSGKFGSVQFAPEGLVAGVVATAPAYINLDRAIPDANSGFAAEIPLALTSSNQVWTIDPAPVLVQKAGALKSAAKKGKPAGKVKKGELVVELASGDGSGQVLVRTATGVTGYLPEKNLELPLKLAGKKVKGAFYRQTETGRYIQLCWDARNVLGLQFDEWNQTLKKAGSELSYEIRLTAGKTKLGAVVLDPAPYRTGVRCPTLHEAQLREHLGVTLD